MHPSSRLRLVLCGAASLALFASGTAWADAAGDSTMMLADGTVRLSPLTVMAARKDNRLPAIRTTSATKTDTPLRDMPQAVAVIPAEVIKDMSMQSMADVVRYTPGVTMGQGEGHRDAPTIRGQSTTADFFVDGVRDDVQYYRDLYNAERIEVLKGPNAMIFGRGGGGGVINRVTRKADWASGREVTLEAGTFEHRRATADLNQPINGNLSARLTAMVEDSGSYRDFVGVQRWAVNPTLSWLASDELAVTLGYEHYDDDRTVDRGIPSSNGRPSPAGRSTFFGDPSQSYATTGVNLFNATIDYASPSGFRVRNHTLIGDYAKFYQNVYPAGPLKADGDVDIAAYSNDTQRLNLFNQTDVTFDLNTGPVRHRMLVGAELGRQTTDNFRKTGTFSTGAFYPVPFASPTVIGVPVTFAQSATDGDNRTEATVAAAYIQDQIELSPMLQVIAGVRFDAFDLDFHNNRNGQDLGRRDTLVSPRLGVVFKPIEPMSFYGGYSVSYLPASGDQFSSLTATSSTLEPEKFENYELGAKWEIRPSLVLTAAVYRLDRTNTTAQGPVAGTIVQTGSQRSRGLEVELSGQITEAWQVISGYAWQDAEITSTTSVAAAGSRVPLVPRDTFSLWSKYQLTPMWGLGLGVTNQSSMYAAIGNKVKLPGFTRVDAAVFVDLTETLSAQLNIENLFDETYFPTSHGDNNIMPGSPRAARVSLTTRF
ncbi:MAG: TonB-dependent receptor [Caulobacteraceae bacterium]